VELNCYKSVERGVHRRISMLEFLLQKPEWENLRVLTNEDLAAQIACMQFIDKLEGDGD